MPYAPAPRPSLEARLAAGLAAHRDGDLAGAMESYRAVLSVEPGNAAALNLLGTALLQAGNAAEAADYLERASRRKRDDPHLLANLGQAYIALERYADAGEAFRKASRIAPREAQFQAGLAAALAMAGKLDEAHLLLIRLTKRFPKSALAWRNLGNVLRDLRCYEQALEAYRTAHALEPGNPEARNSIGRALHSMLRFEDAEREYRACIAAAPDYLIARYNLASVTMDLGRFVEAEVECREIVARIPEAPDAHRLLGTALGHQSRLLDALACYERAARIAPDDPQTAQTYGAALMEAGRSAAGLRWLARAAALEPQSVTRRQVTSGALLAHGLLQDGWIDYAHRPAALELTERHRSLPITRTLPREIPGQRVCVLAEQGLGDQLFFLRYAPTLAALGARVSVRPARKIESLLRRSPAFEHVIPETDHLPPADLYILAGDLPHALGGFPSSARPGSGTTTEAGLRDYESNISIYAPRPAPTLAIPPLAERLEEIRDRLAQSGPAPYIALTWRGGTAPENQQTAAWLLYKSVALASLAGALTGVDGTVVAVQRKPRPGEIDTLATALGRPVHDYTALNDDLEGMLALLSLVDEYIGVSNTNMHLRAAAGRMARVLVPVPAEWRWMQRGAYSPWFPGFPVYRQSLQGDWSTAFARLARDLGARRAGDSRCGGA